MLRSPAGSERARGHSYQELKECPGSIFALKNLETLNLAGNHLRFVQDALGDLTKLETLDLDGMETGSDARASSVPPHPLDRLLRRCQNPRPPRRPWQAIC